MSFLRAGSGDGEISVTSRQRMFTEIRYEYAKSREMFCDRSQNDTCLFLFQKK